MTDRDRVPGTWLRRFAERTFDRQTLDRVILPALADLQHECGAAPGTTLAERFVRVRTYWGLGKAIGLCLLRDARRQSRVTAGAVLSRMAFILPITTLLLMVPALNDARGQFPAVVTVLLLLTSAPQALALGLPIAYFFAVAMDREPRSPLRLLPGVLGLSVLCTLLMLVLSLSVMPRANHAYVTLVENHLKATRGSDQRVSFGGQSGLTFTELVRRSRSGGSDSTSARRFLGMRLTVSTLPLMLGCVALGIADRRHSLRATLFVGIWVLMIYVAAIRSAAPSSRAGPSLEAVWLVNAAFTLAGLGMVWIRAKRNAEC